MISKNKLTRIHRELESRGWREHPRTFARIVDWAVDFAADHPRATAKMAADVAIRTYHARSAGYLDGARDH